MKIHKFIIKLMNIPNAGQPVRRQPKHAHQQHQYSCSILNVVVQFASNPAQAEQSDHLQRAEETADALKTDRKEGGGNQYDPKFDSILVSRQFCFRKLTISRLSKHLHTRLHTHTAFTLEMLMQSQIQTRVSSGPPFTGCTLYGLNCVPEIGTLSLFKLSYLNATSKKSKTQKHRNIFPCV